MHGDIFFLYQRSNKIKLISIAAKKNLADDELIQASEKITLLNWEVINK